MMYSRPLRLSATFLLLLGASLVILPESRGIPHAVAASDGIVIAQEVTTPSPAQREAQRRAVIRERMRRNTLSYIKLIEDATVSSSSALTVPATRSAGYKARLLCRVKDRYVDPDVLPVTKQRLIERVATDLSLSHTAVIDMLEGSLNCAEVLDGLYPYLFYEGNHEQETATPGPVPAPVPVYTPVSMDRPSGTPPAVLPPIGAAIGGTSSSSTAEEIAALEEGDFAPEEDGALTTETMLRILCRVRERGIRDVAAFEQSISGVSARFADRWNVDQDSIASALRNSELCTNPQNITLTMQPTEAVEEPTEVFGPPAPSSAPQEQGTDLMNRIKALPPIILIVGGLTVLTLIALMVLIILPLFRIEE